MTARILLIEDNPDNLRLMEYLLRTFGYKVLEAKGGAEGLEAAASEKPDLILCDINMPKVDGYEVAKRIRADEEMRRIPLVAVTAYAMVGDRDQILARGFDGYIPKPIDPTVFVNQIEEFLAPAKRSNAMPAYKRI